MRLSTSGSVVHRFREPLFSQLSDDRLGNLALFHVNPAFAWDQKIGVKLGHATLSVTGENITGASGAGGSPIPADRRFLFGVKLGL